MRDRFPVITDLRIADKSLDRRRRLLFTASPSFHSRLRRRIFSLPGPDTALPVSVKKINDLAVPPETLLNNGRRDV